MSANLATNEQKTSLQHQVIELINDTNRLNPGGSFTAVQSKRYLTSDNQFVYLTYSQVHAAEVAPIKIQVFRRVPGGVEETIFRIYNDMRFTHENNSMIFGSDPQTAQTAHPVDVTYSEATDLCEIIAGLNPDNERLQWGEHPGGGQGSGRVDSPSTLDDGVVS